MAGESKQIYQLTTGEFTGESLVPFEVPNPDPTTVDEKPKVTRKSSGDAIAEFVAKTQEFQTDLNTDSKTLVGAINEVNSKSNSLFKVREVRLMSDVEVSTQTEYNSNGSSIPHGVVPTEAGYTPIAITNVRAWGYYGSRITLYAWFNDSANSQIAFSAFNAWSNASYQARVNGSCWILYVKNTSV